MKKLITALLSIVLLTVLSVSVGAYSQEQRVFDNAGIFTSSEISSLEDSVAKLREKSGYDVVILTTDYTGGYDTERYADYYYDNGGFGKDGAIFLIDMEHRRISFSTSGEATPAVSQTRADNILDYTQEYAIDGDYYGSAKAFLRKLEPALIKSVTSKELLIIIPVALLVGLIFFVSIKKKYASVGKNENYPFREQSKLNLTKREDIFINKHVTSVRVSSGSGGSGGGGGGGSSSRGSRGF